jgi:hypothetical protein
MSEVNLKLIDRRDYLEDLLDDFVVALGGIDEHGEHSNVNCPWTNALELLRSGYERGRGESALPQYKLVTPCDLSGAVSNAVTESTEESKVQKMHIANSEYQRGKRDGYVEGLLEALSAVLWHCRFNSLEGVSATTFRDALDDEIQARLKEAQG